MISFSNFFASAARKAEDPDDKDKIYRLRRMAIDSVHLVAAGANKRTFLIRKDEGATMKTADMIPGATGIKNSAGVIVTKADDGGSQGACVASCTFCRRLLSQLPRRAGRRRGAKDAGVSVPPCDDD